MAARNYSSVARAVTLSSSVSGSATTFPVSDTTGFPTPPFTLVADPGRSGEEIVTVTNQVGLNLTVVRGQDGTGAQPHDAGATLRHMATARDYREPAEHIALTSDVHGVTGSLVGATQAQDVDNKTFTPAVGDHTPLTFKAASGQTAPMVVFKDSGNNTTGSITTAGRVATPGVDSTKASTFTGAATDVPVTVKAAASHTAHLMSVRDSSNTELLFIEPSGNLNAKDVTATNFTTPGVMSSASISTGTVTSSARVSAVGFDGNGTSVFTPTGTGNTPLVAVSPTGSTASAFVVRDAATSTSQAGVSGENNGFRLYHGGSNTNYLPWRIHAGRQDVTITAGGSATVDTISFSGMGFTQAPIVLLTVAGPDSGPEGRVSVYLNSRNTSQAVVRTIQTQAANLGSNQTYTVYWTAIQMTPSSASG
jgi:hypothetical protein